jgi:hypothetical protein
MTADAWLTDDQRTALTAVLDAVIPPSANGRLPGAGSVGLTEEIEQALAASSELVLACLAAVETGAADQGCAFAELATPARAALLSEIAAAQPAFLPSLIFHVYTRYYQTPEVLEALGLEPRPPYPKGYEIVENDLGLLDPVRGRPKLFREA